MFIGREYEMEQLNTMYNSNKFEFVIIWGRRRVGKTTLISEFTKDKETIFFTGIETTAKENLENFSRSIYGLDNENTNNAPIYNSYQDTLDRIFELAKNKRIILAIDEYPYLAKSYKAISSILQLQIDHKYKNHSKLFIILCGSSMSFMEYQVLGYQSPLYGRRTGQLKIEPFNYFKVKDFYKNFTNEEIAIVYGLTGGIPQYMEMIDDSLSIEDNIKRCFLMSTSYLFEEPTNLLKQELRDPSTYNAIIQAIATGSSKISEISSKTGLASSVLSIYIKQLIDLGIVLKEKPIDSKSERKTIYSIKDKMFNFWYRFIPMNMPSIMRRRIDSVYQKIANELPDYMGSVFESICINYMWEYYEQLPIEFAKIGRWWGNNPKQKREEEIDIVAVDNENNAILCECKWKNGKVGVDVLETLIERSKLFYYKHTYLYIFAKSGFTKGCIDKSKEFGNVKLLSFDEMN